MKSWYKVIAIIILLTLVIPTLVACDDNDGAPSETETQETTITNTTVPTQAQVSSEPVKIGLIGAWTGSYGMVGLMWDQVIDLVLKQVEEQGGILNGRPIEIVKFDGKGEVHGAISGVIKLALQDKVSAFATIGVSAAEGIAALDKIDELQVLGCHQNASLPEFMRDYTYSVRSVPSPKSRYDITASLLIDDLKTKSVSFLAENMADKHEDIKKLKKDLEAAGIEVVGEQYVEPGIKDFSPYITRVMVDKPETVVLRVDSPTDNRNLFTQVGELGGWRDVQVVSWSPGSYTTWQLPLAEGTFHYALWTPGMDNPGAQKFERDFEKEYGKTPGTAELYAYNGLWIAINAIELAGTDDPEDIAKAARSGELSWESPLGLMAFGSDGENNCTGMYVEIRDGSTVIYKQ